MASTNLVVVDATGGAARGRDRTSSEGRVSLSTGLVVVVLGGAVVGVMVASSRLPAPGPTSAAIDQVAAEVDASLREAAASAQSRAQTLAELPRLALAVATDAATLRDLTADELAFRASSNETIEIAQVPRDGGAPVSLLRVPSDSTLVVPLASPGLHLVRAGSALAVSAVVRIEPRARAGELYGVVAVSRLPDLGQVTARLAPLGGGARLETPAGAFQLGGAPAAEHDTLAVNLSLGLGGGAQRGVRLIVPAPAEGGWRAERLGLAIALGAVTLCTALLLRRREMARARGPSSTLMPAGEPPPLPSLAQFRAESQHPDPPPVRSIGSYRVLRRLGTGGMADVFLACVEGEAGFVRKVALKVIRQEMASNPRFVARFLDEARVAARLNHPNILSIIDLGKVADKYLIAMEFIDGADLERMLRATAARQALIPLRIALAIVRHICDGLHFAHTALDGHGEPLHLVHRDVKGANVFVSRNGEVKVGDFGIAKVAGRMRTARTEIGEVKGTAAYMAPEQRAGLEVDPRADIYSVGALCYELLTGQVINLDLAAIAHLGRNGWPHLPPPSSLRPELPPELDAVLFRTMAFDREDRYPTCEALEQALAEIVERHGLSVTNRAIAEWITQELAARPDLAASPSSDDASTISFDGEQTAPEGAA